MVPISLKYPQFEPSDVQQLINLSTTTRESSKNQLNIHKHYDSFESNSDNFNQEYQDSHDS